MQENLGHQVNFEIRKQTWSFHAASFHASGTQEHGLVKPPQAFQQVQHSFEPCQGQVLVT